MFEAGQKPQLSCALVSYSLKKHFTEIFIRSRDFRKTDLSSVIMGSSVKVTVITYVHRKQQTLESDFKISFPGTDI